MNHIIKFDQFVNEAEIAQMEPEVQTEKKPEYWNWERALVVDAVFDKGLYKDKVAKSLVSKLTSTTKGYTYGMLEPKEQALYNKLAGKKEMNPNERPRFWSTG